jgi:hypothetical protein
MAETAERRQDLEPFRVDAERVAARVRNAFAALIAAVPGPVRRASDLRSALGIDGQLAWKVFKVVYVKDPFAAAGHLPGSAAVDKFLKAAARHSLPPERIRSARDAMDDFERLVRVHARNRRALDVMLSGFARDSRSGLEASHRAAAFRGNSYMVGVQARVQLKTFMLQCGSEPDRVDVAGIRGFIGLRRLRPNTSWVISRSWAWDDDGHTRPGLKREPIEPESVAVENGCAVPLLRDYCSKPLPRFRRVVRPPNVSEDELVEGPVGETGAVTCLTAEVMRNAIRRFPEERNRVVGATVDMRTPCEALLLDLFVRHDLYGRLDPELIVYSELAGGLPFPAGGRNRPRVPVSETVEHLGRGSSGAHTPDVPRYAEMVRYVFKRLGWDEKLFDLYRVRMEYPFIPTSIIMESPLPEPYGHGTP